MALRAQGITRFGGVALTEAAAAGRARRYDTMHRWPADALEHGGFDVVVWNGPGGYGLGLPDIMARAHALLSGGGMLILRMTGAEVAETTQPFTRGFWDDWLYAHGFHLLLLQPAAPGASWNVLVARKYARSVFDVSKEIYERFPGGGEAAL